MSIGRNDTCYCGSGQKYKKCCLVSPKSTMPLGIHPKSRAAFVYNLYSEIDNKLATAHTPKISPCEPGCTNCCSDFFGISFIEFKVICKEIRDWPNEDVKKLHILVAEQWNYVKEKYPKLAEHLDKDANIEPEVLSLDSLVSRETKLRLPCPLLDTHTKLCRIYNVRPLICRTHGKGYLFDNDSPTCDLIPPSLPKMHWAVNLTDLYTKGASLSFYKYMGQQIYERRYPIFYFLKMIFDIDKSNIVITNEDRYFSLAWPY